MHNENLENAIAVTHQIRDALRAEVDRAQGVADLVSDGYGIFEVFVVH